MAARRGTGAAMRNDIRGQPIGQPATPVDRPGDGPQGLALAGSRRSLTWHLSIALAPVSRARAVHRDCLCSTGHGISRRVLRRCKGLKPVDRLVFGPRALVPVVFWRRSILHSDDRKFSGSGGLLLAAGFIRYQFRSGRHVPAAKVPSLGGLRARSSAG